MWEGGEEARDSSAPVEHAVRLAREAEVDGDARQERGVDPSGRGEAAGVDERDGLEVREDVRAVLFGELERGNSDEAVGVRDVPHAFCVGFNDGRCLRGALNKDN